jgi:hypothetical protein
MFKRIAALTATAAVLAPAHAYAAAPTSASLTLSQLGIDGGALTGTSPVREVKFPVPPSWKATQLDVELSVNASNVRPGQVLEVYVDGVRRSQSWLHSGVQQIRLTTPALPGGAVDLQVIGLLGSLNGPITPAGDSGASLTIGPSSTVTVRALALGPAPTLSQLPAALADRIGPNVAPLTVALPANPSSVALRSAIIAAGAFAQADGYPGLNVNVTTGGDGQQLADAPGPILAVDERPGTATVAVDRLPTGQLRLTVAGNGHGLLDAARLISSPRIAALSGSSAMVPAHIVAPLTQDPVVKQVPIGAGETTGSGQLTVTGSFTVPVERQLDTQALLQLAAGYSSPAGGRLTVSVNGNTLGAVTVPGNGTVRKVMNYKLADDPTLAGDLKPGWYLQSGLNQLTVTAQPQPATSTEGGVVPQLQLLSDSSIKLKTKPRPAMLQLGLWPFPLYNTHAWSRTTLVVPRSLAAGTLASTIAALANTERLTGVPADPAVTFKMPSAEELSGNLIVVSDPGRNLPPVELAHSQPELPGVLEEIHISGGGVALLAYGARSLTLLAQGYNPGVVNGRAAAIDEHGQSHILATGRPVVMFRQPARPWLAPAALLAVFVLGWIALRTVRARRRMRALPEFAVDGAS